MDADLMIMIAFVTQVVLWGVVWGALVARSIHDARARARLDVRSTVAARAQARLGPTTPPARAGELTPRILHDAALVVRARRIGVRQ